MITRLLLKCLTACVAPVICSGCVLFLPKIDESILELETPMRELQQHTGLREGSYLGEVSRGGVSYRDYRFPAALRGDERELQILVPADLLPEQKYWSKVGEREVLDSGSAGAILLEQAPSASQQAAAPARLVLQPVAYWPSQIKDESWQLLELARRDTPHVLLLCTRTGGGPLYATCGSTSWVRMDGDASQLQWVERHHGDAVPLHLLKVVVLPVDIVCTTVLAAVFLPIWALMGFPDP